MKDSPVQTIRVALYARVSTEEQRDGQTIDSQVAELEYSAKEKGWQITGVYKDEGWSGTILARPELDQLRDQAAKGLFDAVLINDVDRLARDVSHLGIIKRDLERRGVQVIFRKLPAEKSPTYNLMVNILGSFAEFERELIADRTRRGRRHKVEVRQQFIGALAAYGFRYIPKDRSTGTEGKLDTVPEEATVVRQMYEWVDKEGLSARRVVQRLNAMNISTRKGKRRWAKSSVLRILRNEIYAGVWYYNKNEKCEASKPVKTAQYNRSPKSSNRLRPRSDWLPVVLPQHLRIIERDQWERAQRQLTANIAFSPRNAKHQYLLKGLIKCGECGARYVGDPNHGKFYYRCLTRCGKLPAIREECLNEVVWHAIQEAVLNPSLIAEQLKKFYKREKTNAQGMRTEIDKIEEALRQVQKEESRIIEAYRTGVLSPAQLSRELEQFKVRRGSLEARKAKIATNPDLPDFSLIERSLIEYCEIAARRLKSYVHEERQRFLQLLLTGILFEGDRVRIKGIIPLEPLKDQSQGPDGYGSNKTKAVLSNGIETATRRLRDRNSLSKEDSIATTMLRLRDRNSVREKDRAATAMAYRHSHNSVVDEVNFELLKPLPERPSPLHQQLTPELLRSLIEQRPSATLKQLCEQVKSEYGVVLSVTSMSRLLIRQGLTKRSRRQFKATAGNF